MKVKRLITIIALAAILAWATVTTYNVASLMNRQAILVDSIIVLQDSLSDLYDYVLEPFNATLVSLSDETKELVENLRWKHYGYGTLYCSDESVVRYVEPEWESLYFEDGTLYVETKDGTWFIEMQRKED